MVSCVGCNLSCHHKPCLLEWIIFLNQLSWSHLVSLRDLSWARFYLHPSCVLLIFSRENAKCIKYAVDLTIIVSLSRNQTSSIFSWWMWCSNERCVVLNRSKCKQMHVRRSLTPSVSSTFLWLINSNGTHKSLLCWRLPLSVFISSVVWKTLSTLLNLREYIMPL